MFFVLAGLTGINSAYAQAVDQAFLDAAPAACPVPTPLTNCGVGDPLHPVAGVTYHYIIDAGGVGNKVQWFVADDTTPLITAGAVTATIDSDGGTGKYILDALDGVYNNTTTNVTADITISWKAFDGTTNNVVLVAFVTDAAGCTNNIQAWKIEPQYSFILQIAGLLDGGTTPATGNAFECVSPVQGAIWDGTNVTMDYGDNYVFYQVTAANFIHGWTPTFTVDASGTSSVVTASANVEWAYADEANAGTAANWHAMTDPVLAAHYSSAVNDAIGPNGACIVLRVLVDHGANEIATAGEAVTVNVDGVMWNSETSAYDTKYPDLDDAATSGGACVVGSSDAATYDITPRPVILPSTPTDPFVPKN